MEVVDGCLEGVTRVNVKVGLTGRSNERDYDDDDGGDDDDDGGGGDDDGGGGGDDDDDEGGMMMPAVNWICSAIVSCLRASKMLLVFFFDARHDSAMGIGVS